MDKRLERILPSVQKPARYTGGEYNEIIKDKSAVKLRMEMCIRDRPSRGATTPVVAMSSTLWKTAGFLPRTSGVWWQSSMRSLISAGWRRPSNTLRTAPTDLGTSCPKVEQGKRVTPPEVPPSCVSPRDKGDCRSLFCITLEGGPHGRSRTRQGGIHLSSRQNPIHRHARLQGQRRVHA